MYLHHGQSGSDSLMWRFGQIASAICDTSGQNARTSTELARSVTRTTRDEDIGRYVMDLFTFLGLYITRLSHTVIFSSHREIISNQLIIIFSH